MFNIYEFSIKGVILIFFLVLQANATQKYYRNRKVIKGELWPGWFFATIWCFLYFLDFIKQYIEL